MPISSTYAMLLVDAYRENGEFLAFDEGGADALTASETAASTGAALLDKKLDMWAPVTAADRTARAAEYLQRARNFVTQRDLSAAMEALNQSLALDPGQREAQVFLGDILLSTDPLGAAAAYRRALDSGAAQPGPTWEKIATSYATAKDWPRTLDAGRRALAMQWDTASLRMAMATAQFGRAELFRKANRDDSADEAEADARLQLDRARELSPDDPNITRLLAQQLVAQGRVREATESLDKLMAIVEEPDLDLLTLYATALTERSGRDVDAFLAWARVWRQSGVSGASMNAVRYRRISEGFDQYVSDTARQAAHLTLGVANGTLPRETAFLQLQKMAEDTKAAETAIKVLQPPSSVLNEANHASRLFAATMISQAVNSYRVYLETGDDIYRSRANELHRQAIMQLNIARGAKTGVTR
jgi:tetratricopeptide (TPR) repeat protein